MAFLFLSPGVGKGPGSAVLGLNMQGMCESDMNRYDDDTGCVYVCACVDLDVSMHAHSSMYRCIAPPKFELGSDCSRVEVIDIDSRDYTAARLAMEFLTLSAYLCIPVQAGSRTRLSYTE